MVSARYIGFPVAAGHKAPPYELPLRFWDDIAVQSLTRFAGAPFTQGSLPSVSSSVRAIVRASAIGKPKSSPKSELYDRLPWFQILRICGSSRAAGEGLCSVRVTIANGQRTGLFPRIPRSDVQWFPPGISFFLSRRDQGPALRIVRLPIFSLRRMRCRKTVRSSKNPFFRRTIIIKIQKSRPQAAFSIKTYFVSFLFSLISSSTSARKTSGDMEPSSTPFLERTETVPDSISLSPMTSI